MKLEGLANKDNTCSYWADGCVKRTHALPTQNLLSNIYSIAVNNEIVVVADTVIALAIRFLYSLV